MLFKLKENYFQYSEETGKFLSYGNTSFPRFSHGGCWFKCSEEESNRLRKGILAGLAEVTKKLPGWKKEF